jgi:hypothetical protein
VKKKLVPGEELDFLTPAEAAALLQSVFREEVQERVHAQSPATATDNTGAVSLEVYTVPMGMEFRLARVIVEADGVTYAAMFVNAAGSVTIQRGGQVVDGFNLSAGIPNTWTSGKEAAPRYRNGEKVFIVVVGGPATRNMSARIEGDLFPDRAPGAA